MQCRPVWGKLPLRVMSIKAFPGESPRDNSWSLEEDVLIPLTQDSLLTRNHLAEVVKKIIAMLLPSRWIFGGHRMVAAVPSEELGLKASQELPCPQWWSSRSPGQNVGFCCETPHAHSRQPLLFPGYLQEGQAFGQEQRGAVLPFPLPAEQPRLWLPGLPAHLLAWHAAHSQVVRQFHGCQKNLGLNRWPGYAAKPISCHWLLTEQGCLCSQCPGLRARSGLPLPLHAAARKPCHAPGKASVPWVLLKHRKTSFCTKIPSASQDDFRAPWYHWAQTPDSWKRSTSGAETPAGPHGQGQVGQAEHIRACFGLKSQLPSSCTWEAAKKLELALGTGKLGRQWEKQTLPSWWHWVKLKGQLLSSPFPGLAETPLAAPHSAAANNP